MDLQLYFMFLGYLVVFLTASLPISELRGAIPLAVYKYGFSLEEAFLVSILGNFLPVFIVLPLLGPLSNFLRQNFLIFEKFFSWLFEKTQRRHMAKFERFKKWALLFLVAVPLPFTGAWTGILASFVFGISKKESLPIICLGVVLAGMLVSGALILGGDIVVGTYFW